jgi:hypothetical protein
MAKTTASHPFLTFIASGLIAVVLVGGGLASLSAVQQNQDTSTQAYGGRKPWPTVSPRPTVTPSTSPKAPVMKKPGNTPPPVRAY